MDHYMAYIRARSTAENLLLAYAAVPTEYARQFHEEQAAKDLARLADEIGFDLVKREPAKQSEAA